MCEGNARVSRDELLVQLQSLPQIIRSHVANFIIHMLDSLDGKLSANAKLILFVSMQLGASEGPSTWSRPCRGPRGTSILDDSRLCDQVHVMQHRGLLECSPVHRTH
jgi:hypothetical protein